MAKTKTVFVNQALESAKKKFTQLGYLPHNDDPSDLHPGDSCLSQNRDDLFMERNEK